MCWSLAYKAALWTRLEDGNHAWLLVRKALFSVTTQEVGYDNGGGVYVNLFDACPPFQIDGNFGVTRSSANCCCNRNWEKSNCCLRAHGGFQVDETRQNGKLISATLLSDTGEPCSVSYGGKTFAFKIKKEKCITLNGNLDLN